MSFMSLETGEPPYTFSTASPSLIREISECLDRFCSLSPEDTVKHLPELLEFESREGFEHAMWSQLDSDNDIKRVVVASTLRVYFEAVPEAGPAKIVEKCERIMAQSLGHISLMVRYMAAGLISNWMMMAKCQLPAQMLSPLRKMVSESDEYLSMLAAMALASSPDPEPEAYRILNRRLDSVDGELAGLVAAALLKLEINNRRALATIKVRFATLSPFIQRPILVSIYKSGPNAVGLFNEVAAILVNSPQEELTHHLAAMALGSISYGTDRATPLLMKALRSSKSMVMDGAVIGLAASQRVPHEAIDLIVTRIFDPDVQLRRSAASAMETLGNFDASGIAILIGRLRDETDREALMQVTRALASAGKPAIPPLLECLVRGNAQESFNAANALVTMGEAAAEGITDFIPSIQDGQELLILLNVLESMGRRAAPAVPTFAECLEVIESEVVALHIVRMFYFCGPPAECAVPSLICYIAEHGSDNDDVNIWIKRTLTSHLPHSSDALRQAIVLADGEARQRLEAMLAEIDRVPSTSSSRLTGFHSVPKIKRFIAMGDMLLANGPNSLRGLAALLKGELSKGARKGYSANNLSRAVKSLEDWLKEPLTSPRKNTTFALTPNGQAILNECKLFLKDSQQSKKP
jgi:hypothetical protein